MSGTKTTFNYAVVLLTIFSLVFQSSAIYAEELLEEKLLSSETVIIEEILEESNTEEEKEETPEIQETPTSEEVLEPTEPKVEEVVEEKIVQKEIIEEAPKIESKEEIEETLTPEEALEPTEPKVEEVVEEKIVQKEIIEEDLKVEEKEIVEPKEEVQENLISENSDISDQITDTEIKTNPYYLEKDTKYSHLYLPGQVIVKLDEKHIVRGKVNESSSEGITDHPVDNDFIVGVVSEILEGVEFVDEINILDSIPENNIYLIGVGDQHNPINLVERLNNTPGVLNAELNLLFEAGAVSRKFTPIEVVAKEIRKKLKDRTTCLPNPLPNSKKINPCLEKAHHLRVTKQIEGEKFFKLWKSRKESKESEEDSKTIGVVDVDIRFGTGTGDSKEISKEFEGRIKKVSINGGEASESNNPISVGTSLRFGEYNDKVDRSHGTSVASVAVANKDNIIGAYGVSYNSKILGFTLDDFETMKIAKAIREAKKRGVDVLNLSFRKSFSVEELLELNICSNKSNKENAPGHFLKEKGRGIVYEAIKDFSGAVVVIAENPGNVGGFAKESLSGNGSRLNFYSDFNNSILGKKYRVNDEVVEVDCWEGLTNVISVGGAIDTENLSKVESFGGGFGDNVDIIAPAENIFLLNLKFDDHTTTFSCEDKNSCNSGNSFAAPQVSATVAMMLSINPNLTPDEIATIINKTGAEPKKLAGRSKKGKFLDIEKALITTALGEDTKSPKITVKEGSKFEVEITEDSKYIKEISYGQVLFPVCPEGPYRNKLIDYGTEVLKKDFAFDKEKGIATFSLSNIGFPCIYVSDFHNNHTMYDGTANFRKSIKEFINSKLNGSNLVFTLKPEITPPTGSDTDIRVAYFDSNSCGSGTISGASGSSDPYSSSSVYSLGDEISIEKEQEGKALCSQVTFTQGDSSNEKQEFIGFVSFNGDDVSLTPEKVDAVDTTDPTIAITLNGSTATINVSDNESSSFTNLKYFVTKRSSCKNINYSRASSYENGVAFTITDISKNGENLCATATDEADNVGYAKYGPLELVDTKSPTLNLRVRNGNVVNIRYSDNDRVSKITYGFSTSTATCDYTNSGDTRTFAVGDNNRVLSITISDETKNGNHLCVRAHDPSGNTQEAFTRSLRVQDITIPELNITVSGKDVNINVSDNKSENFSKLTYGFSSSSSCSGSEYTNGGTYRDDEDFTITDLDNDGDYICATATDEAGNPGYAASSIALVIEDEEAPTVSVSIQNGNIVIIVTSDNVELKELTYGFSGDRFCFRNDFTDADDARTPSNDEESFSDDKKTAEFRIAITDTTRENDKVCVLVTDKAGNEAKGESSTELTIPDIIDPTFNITINNNEVTINVSDNKSENFSKLAYGFSSNSSCSGNEYTNGGTYRDDEDFTITDLDNDGDYICATATDEAGNPGYAVSSKTLIIEDEEAPTVSVSIKNGNVVTVVSSDNVALDKLTYGFTLLNVCSYTNSGKDDISLGNEKSKTIDITVTDENLNGKRICIRVHDSAKNTTEFKLDEKINVPDIIAPTFNISINNNEVTINVSDNKSRSFSRSSLRYAFSDRNNCNSLVYPSSQTYSDNQRFSIIQRAALGKHVCARAEDEAGNPGYGYSSSIVQFVDDHGDSRANATNITAGSSVNTTNGNLHSDSEPDYFKFTVSSIGLLTVYTTGTTDTMGELQDSNGNDLEDDDDSGTTGKNFSFVKRLTPGTYYIEVREGGVFTSNLGSYVLYTKFESNPNGSFATAETASLDSSGNYRSSETIRPETDEDYFRVSIPGAGTLRIYATGGDNSGGIDTTGTLYNSSQTKIGDDSSASGSLDFDLTEDVTSGTYYIKITGDSAKDEGRYTLVLKFTPTTDDHGDSRATATSITVGSSVNTTNGNLQSDSESDYFKFVVRSVGLLTAYTTGTTDTMGELQNSGGSKLKDNDNSGTGNNFSFIKRLTPGTYYIKIEEGGVFTSNLGNYVLYTKFESDTNGSFATAQTASLDSSGNYRSSLETIRPETDEDYFRVSIPSAGTLRIYATRDGRRDGIDTTGTLYDSRQREIDDDSSAFGSLDFDFTEDVTSGTYYVKITGDEDDETGTYTLVLKFTPTPSSDDHGDSRGDATSITLGRSVRGDLETILDEDFFKFTTSKTGTITVYTTGSTDTEGLLEDSRGRNLKDNEDSGSGKNFRFSYKITSAGTYYISVEGDDALDKGPYTLVTSFAADSSTSTNIGRCPTQRSIPGDDNGIITNAQVISPYSVGFRGGKISPSGDKDYFCFVIPSRGTLTVDTRGSIDTFGILYDSRRRKLEDNDDSGTDKNFEIERRVSAGVYYLLVRGYDSGTTGTYDLRIDLD